jgi:hypothetical protein
MKTFTLTSLAICLSLLTFGQLNQINLPINWEGTTTNYTVTDFGGNASTLVVDPTLAGNTVLKSDKTAGAQLWAGTTLSTPSGLASAIPFSAGNTIITARVWSPHAGIQVRLKAEVVGDPTKSVETEATHTTANGWQTLSFDFSSQAPGTAAINFSYTYNMLSIFYNFGVDGATAGLKTYYCDDIMFGSGSTLQQVSLPITFDSDSVDYNLVSFGGALESIVVDPTNATNKVLKQEKPAGAQTWGGTVLGNTGLASAIPFAAGSTTMRARVWAADAGTPVLMKVENVSNGAISVETMATTTVAAGWQTLFFDFTNNQPGTPALDLNATYGKVVIFCDFGNAGSGKTFYVDDVNFGGSGIGVEEASWTNNVSVYPNPSNGIFNVSSALTSASDVTITVTDVQGRIIYKASEKGFGSMNHTINIDFAPNGIYFVNISSNTASSHTKVLLQR